MITITKKSTLASLMFAWKSDQRKNRSLFECELPSDEESKGSASSSQPQSLLAAFFEKMPPEERAEIQVLVIHQGGGECVTNLFKQMNRVVDPLFLNLSTIQFLQPLFSLETDEYELMEQWLRKFPKLTALEFDANDDDDERLLAHLKTKFSGLAIAKKTIADMDEDQDPDYEDDDEEYMPRGKNKRTRSSAKEVEHATNFPAPSSEALEHTRKFVEFRDEQSRAVIVAELKESASGNNVSGLLDIADTESAAGIRKGLRRIYADYNQLDLRPTALSKFPDSESVYFPIVKPACLNLFFDRVLGSLGYRKITLLLGNIDGNPSLELLLQYLALVTEKETQVVLFTKKSPEQREQLLRTIASSHQHKLGHHLLSGYQAKAEQRKQRFLATIQAKKKRAIEVQQPQPQAMTPQQQQLQQLQQQQMQPQAMTPQRQQELLRQQFQEQQLKQLQQQQFQLQQQLQRLLQPQPQALTPQLFPQQQLFQLLQPAQQQRAIVQPLSVVPAVAPVGKSRLRYPIRYFSLQAIIGSINNRLKEVTDLNGRIQFLEEIKSGLCIELSQMVHSRSLKPSEDAANSNIWPSSANELVSGLITLIKLSSENNHTEISSAILALRDMFNSTIDTLQQLPAQPPEFTLLKLPAQLGSIRFTNLYGIMKAFDKHLKQAHQSDYRACAEQAKIALDKSVPSCFDEKIPDANQDILKLTTADLKTMPQWIEAIQNVVILFANADQAQRFKGLNFASEELNGFMLSSERNLRDASVASAAAGAVSTDRLTSVSRSEGQEAGAPLRPVLSAANSSTMFQQSPPRLPAAASAATVNPERAAVTPVAGPTLRPSA